MPIPVVCSGCGKRFQAPDKGAGRKVPCPVCQATISIPKLNSPTEEEDEYRLADETAPARPTAFPEPQPKPVASLPPPLPRERQFAWTPPPAAEPATVAAGPPTSAPVEDPATSAVASGPVKGWVPPTKSTTPPWLRHLHWFLALATIPLAISIFVPDESPEELEQRIARSLPAPDDPSALEAFAEEAMSGGDPFLLLPGRKIEGAFLARDSWLHWLFAIVSVTAYMTFFVFLASDRSANALHLLGLGGFTATIGILLLLAVQALAMGGVIGGRGIVGLVLLLFALIGLSYRMALDPDVGLIPSFIGFTAGVGLCEELVKALPLLILYKVGTTQTWRGAFLWGMASGAGFGVSEGIMYSQDFYNGIAGPGIYVVRFVSCVALHAIWAGSVGISINQRQYDLQEDYDEAWWMYAVAVLRMIAIPMVLHGLYDTLLKKEMDILALLVAAASFGYLAWQISRLRTSDDEDERAAYVARFIRSRAQAGRGQSG